MSVYERTKGSGIWYARWPVSKNRITGKIAYKKKKVGPKQLAERVERKGYDEWAEKDFYGNVYDMSFSELCKWYLEQKRAEGKKSIAKDEQHCEALKKEFGDDMLTTIRPKKVKAYRNKLRRTISARKTVYADSTINKIFQIGRHMFNLAIEEEIVFTPNPFNGSMLRENNARDRTCSAEEFQALVNNAADHLKPIIEVGYYTGMRIGEILGLTWNRVNMKDGCIVLEAEHTKTEHPRTVYSTARVKEILEGLNKIRSIADNHVFIYQGKPVKSIKTAWRTACKDAKISNLRFHDLRHTANTNMRKAGVPKSVIMKLMGHKTDSMHRRYDTVDRNDAKEAMARLEEFLNCPYIVPTTSEAKK